MKEYLNAFKALSDKTRLRIMYLLETVDFALCVCEIMDSLQESQFNISRHLKVLQNAGLVEEKKDGRWMLYKVTTKKNPFEELLAQAITSLPKEMFQKDLARLQKRITFRKQGKCVIGMNSPDWQKILLQLEQES